MEAIANSAPRNLRSAAAPVVAAQAGAGSALHALRVIVLLDVALIPFSLTWGLGGDQSRPGSEVSLGSSDVLIALLVAGLFPQLGLVVRYVRAMPYRLTWLAYVTLVCIAYLVAPTNQQYFNSALGVAYQLYRYCCKWPLAYIIVGMFARPLMARGALPLVLTASTDCAAVIAIQQGFQGLRASGPFGHPNELGAFLLVPLFLAGSSFFMEKGRGLRLFYLLSALLQLRAFMFTESRGAWLSFAAGSLVAALLLARSKRGRRVLGSMCAGVFGILVLVPLIKPDFAKTEFAQRVFSLHDPTEAGTFEWREERWKHFLPMVLANPLLGVGECEDRSLTDETARTPHNGYMARALVSGIPAMLILVCFGVHAVRRAVRRFGRVSDPAAKAMALATACGLFSLAVHNFVDSSIEFNPVMKLFWVLVGLSVSRG